MSSPTRTTRLTSVDALDVAIPLVLAAVAATVAVTQAGQYLLADTITVPDAVMTVSPDAAGIGRAAAVGLASVDLTDPSTGARLALAATTLLPGVLAALGGWLLYRILASMVAGKAFTTANIRRLHGLTVLILVGGMVGPLLDAVVRAAVLDTPGHSQMSMTISAAPLVAAICTSTAALAFRRGRDLEDDVEGLV